MGGESRESWGRLESSGTANLVDPECPAGGPYEQGAGSELALVGGASRETQHLKPQSRGWANPHLISMIGGERLTQRSLAECPGSAGIQLSIREAGGAAWRVARGGASFTVETTRMPARGLAVAGGQLGSEQAEPCPRVKRGPVRSCRGYVWAGVKVQILWGWYGERRGGGRAGHLQTLDAGAPGRRCHLSGLTAPPIQERSGVSRERWVLAPWARLKHTLALAFSS